MSTPIIIVFELVKLLFSVNALIKLEISKLVSTKLLGFVMFGLKTFFAPNLDIKAS